MTGNERSCQLIKVRFAPLVPPCCSTNNWRCICYTAADDNVGALVESSLDRAVAKVCIGANYWHALGIVQEGERIVGELDFSIVFVKVTVGTRLDVVQQAINLVHQVVPIHVCDPEVKILLFDLDV